METAWPDTSSSNADDRKVWDSKLIETVPEGAPHGVREGSQFNIELLYLEFDLNVAMGGGGGFATGLDQLVKYITYLELVDKNSYFDSKTLTGTDIGFKERMLPSNGDFWNFLSSPVAPPGVSANADVVIHVPVPAWCVPPFATDEEKDKWSIDIRYLVGKKLKLFLDEDSNIDANISAVTGTVRLMAKGRYSRNITVPPKQSFVQLSDIGTDENVFKEFANNTMMPMFAVWSPTQSYAASDEVLEIKVDGHHVMDSLQRTAAQHRRWRRGSYRQGGHLDEDSSTGAKYGVTDTVFSNDNYFFINDGRGSFGEQLRPTASLGIKKHGSWTNTAKLMIWRVEPQTRATIKQFSDGIKEKLTSYNYALQDGSVGFTEGIALPVEDTSIRPK